MWQHGHAIQNNWHNMKIYERELLERNRQLNAAMHSNHTGVNYDLRTIVNPRRYQVSTNPSLGLLARSHSVYN
jgi:hypothetical protein